MNDTNDRFIRIYEEIKAEVNRCAGHESATSFQIDKAAERDSIVQRNRRLLKYIRDVRNVVQHPDPSTQGDAVQISKIFLDQVQKLLSRLKNPQTAYEVGVPLKKILTASRTDRLGDLADAMKQKGYSHVPILDENGAVTGVFNEAAVFDYLRAETIVDREMQISDIFPHCRLATADNRLDTVHSETFTFRDPRTKLDDLVEIFRAVESETKRVGAVFITASGKKSEPLQRLITPWDVLEKFSFK